jgi:hypothetical protein
MFAPEGEYVAPDMFDITIRTWVEAKHKSVFTWHRKTQQWCTGIDLNHYREYIDVEDISRFPVWLLFLHRCAIPDARDIAYKCPSSCPVGLFGNKLSYLKNHESHRHDKWGRYGMVYWAVQDLKLLAFLEDLDLGVAA